MPITRLKTTKMVCDRMQRARGITASSPVILFQAKQSTQIILSFAPDL